ncbi:hypothetical protein F4802DRAFT_571024 [Xylaria palmicola]|nr:hypothetical protein F4802DRAFT_571024 [Xylaria palmicola]
MGFSVLDQATFFSLHIIQAVLSIITIGIYAYDLSVNKEYIDEHGKWARIYALVVGALSILYSAALLLSLILSSQSGPALNVIMSAQWASIFVLFGSAYFDPHTAHDARHAAHLRLMLVGVWVDLANMVLWIITAGASSLAFCLDGIRQNGIRQSRLTGGAKV